MVMENQIAKGAEEHIFERHTPGQSLTNSKEPAKIPALPVFLFVISSTIKGDPFIVLPIENKFVSWGNAFDHDSKSVFASVDVWNLSHLGCIPFSLCEKHIVVLSRKKRAVNK